MAWKLGKRLGHCVGFGATEIKISVMQRLKRQLSVSLPTTYEPHESESEVPQSCRLFVTPWTVARQALLSMEFSRHEY